MGKIMKGVLLTAAAIGLLYAGGKLGLDRPIEDGVRGSAGYARSSVEEAVLPGAEGDVTGYITGMYAQMDEDARVKVIETGFKGLPYETKVEVLDDMLERVQEQEQIQGQYE